jgi:hypothetical protein
MVEIWRDIKDYEGLYQVSNLGRVRSVDHYVNYKNIKKRLILGKILNLNKDNRGYYVVTLSKDNVRKNYSVHRLVAEAFIPNPDNLPTVDHIDRNRLNNNVENLRWADYKLQQYNCDREAQAKALSKPVLQYTLDMVFVAEYPSAAEAARQTGISHTNIIGCCNSKYGYKSAGNYKWVYTS